MNDASLLPQPLIAGTVQVLTQAPGGIGGNVLRFPALETLATIPVVATEEGPAAAAQFCILAEAIKTTTSHSSATKAEVSARKRIIDEASASEGQSGNEARNLL
jgi:hypothetical protein